MPYPRPQAAPECVQNCVQEVVSWHVDPLGIPAFVFGALLLYLWVDARRKESLRKQLEEDMFDDEFWN
jgi:hypothetical protein